MKIIIKEPTQTRLLHIFVSFVAYTFKRSTKLTKEDDDETSTIYFDAIIYKVSLLEWSIEIPHSSEMVSLLKWSIAIPYSSKMVSSLKWSIEIPHNSEMVSSLKYS